MDILYRQGKASASDVREQMEDAPSYSAVRAMLRVLEEKGHVRHQAEGLKYVYLPTVARDKAKRTAVKHVLETFFNGSPEQAVAALGLARHQVVARARHRLARDLRHATRLSRRAPHCLDCLRRRPPRPAAA